MNYNPLPVTLLAITKTLLELNPLRANGNHNYYDE